MRNLNTFRKRRANWCQIFICLLAGLVIVCLADTIRALDPNRAVSQYSRTFWGIEKGFPGGTIYAIAQTKDGYLWLGTEKGLVRFDGLEFLLLQPANTPSSPAEPILGLITDDEGSLWLRLRGTKIIRYRDGKFEDVLTDLRRPDFRITAMSRGNDGKVLLSTLGNGSLRFTEKEFVSVVPKSELPTSVVISLAETQAGDIWMGTRDAGLYRFKEQKTSAVTNKLPDRKINSLLADGERELWIGTDKGIVHWNGDELTDADVPPILKSGQILTMLKDRQSNIWVGTESNGLLRLNANGLAETAKSETPSGKMVTALFEDREGNLWAGSPQGIERFRDNAFMTYSMANLPSDSNGAVYVDSELKTWFAPTVGGLYWLKGNQIGNVTADELDKDIIYSIAGGKEDLWIGRQRGGLTHLRFNGGNPIIKTYTQAEGLAQNSVYTIYQSRDGTVWSGTLSGGVSRLQDGRFTTYTSADGLAANSVTAIAETQDGTVWFATPSGVSSLSKNNWRTFTIRDGLPAERINCLLEDSSGVMWFGTAKGLAFFRENRIQFYANVPVSLREPILGLAEDKSGALWIATTNHVLQVNREKTLNGTLGESDVREFGLADGLAGIEGVKRSRSVVADSMGRIWFSLNKGLSVVNTERLKNDSVPVIVHIKNVLADNVRLDLQDSVRISAVHQRITISFAGLSLSMPERVKFRYRLEGFDGNWSEPTANTEAIYTNLSPGLYQFRVMASSGDGLWNSTEATIKIEIEPMFWQTWWFRFLCLLAVALMLLGLYRVRLRRLTGQLNLRFEERLAERTRIAQELHDSLLQGFVGASMQLDVAIDRLPDDSSAKSPLTHVLQIMRRVTEEGRNTVRGLRSSHTNDSINLEQAFSRFWQELSVTEEMDFRIIVEGSPRPLHPLVRDEVYRIGCEAMVNASRHSKASKIEFEIEFAAKFFKILIRDDGCGIDQQILRAGREGHWGLSGMRERAEKIGGKLKVWSRASAGTEVELTVPNHIALEASSTSQPRKWFGRLRLPEAQVQYSKREQEK